MLIEAGLGAADHDRQRPLAGALDPTGDRRVQRRDPSGLELVVDQDGHLGARGGEVDEGLDLGAVDHAGRAQGGVLDHLGARQAGEHQLALVCNLLRGRGPPGAAIGQRLNRRVAEVHDREGVAGVDQTASHEPAHAAEPDETDMHVFLPSSFERLT